MPRRPRIDMPGYHHVLNRGVNRENVFLCDDDKNEFLHFLDNARQIYNLTIHSFCILDNHYHLLLETHQNNLSLALRYVNSQYAIYFNKKMSRVGPLWQGRFKSWYVYDDVYFRLLLRYIEMNPVKAGIVENIGDYEHASAYCIENSQWLSLLSSSFLFTKDVRDWLTPLRNNELVKLTACEKTKFDKKDGCYAPEKKIPLADYFCRTEGVSDRNFNILKACMDGYRQGDVARYLNLSAVAVSRIVASERAKCDLFQTIRDRGLFWSYSADVAYNEKNSKLLIETVLKYSDLDDIRSILKLFGSRKVKNVWELRLVNDSRFKKLNYFLARVLFNLDVEADYFAEAKQTRGEKLRLLAG